MILKIQFKMEDIQRDNLKLQTLLTAEVFYLLLLLMPFFLKRNNLIFRK